MSQRPEPLTFDRPVHRSLVHRRSTHEVLPTDFAELGGDAFEIALQWPRRHPVLKSTPLRSGLVAETIRQATILTCHLGYGVKHGTRFLMTGLGFDLTGSRLRTVAGDAIEVLARARGNNVRRTVSGLRSVRIDFSFSQHGVDIAQGHGDAMLVDEVAYARMRGSRRDAHAPVGLGRGVLSPAAVGVDFPEDVLLRSDSLGWLVAVDGAHPTYFDHPLDHVPGVAIIEAFRQLACAESGDPTVDLITFEAEFARMVEFDSPARASIRRMDAGARFVLTQGDVVAVDASAVVASTAAITTAS